jgi:predicted enzyme related to lactoylglutathione lyase
MGRPVTHFQILSKNPDLSQRFYAELFDWKISRDNPLDYRMIDTGAGRGIDGGIWPAPPEGHAFLQVFVEVDDVARYAARAKELGGNVIVPPQSLPGGDEMAILLDADGIPLGLFKPAATRANGSNAAR